MMDGTGKSMADSQVRVICAASGDTLLCLRNSHALIRNFMTSARKGTVAKL